MAFCNKEKQLIDSGTTCVDNKFFLNYLPDAPDVRSAVYLMGLALAQSDGEDNSCQTIANKLNITTDDVMSAYLYWEELGLVHITSDNPQRVIYLAVRGSASALKKINANKYKKFSKDIQAVIEGRMLTVNEYNAYYTFLENTTFEPDALVAVAKYCAELKGNDINYNYVLTVARNLLAKGQTTLATVQDQLNSTQKYDDDLRLVFKALGTNRKMDYADRERYEKWTKDFGFTLEVVVAVAKNCKQGGMDKLDAKLLEYYKRGALSTKEIDTYEQQKTFLLDLARNVNKTIGVYYQSLDMIVDEYVVNWLRKGFEANTLLAIAKYCFTSGIRTLNGMATVIDKLFKAGITTIDALHAHLDALAARDEQIAAVLSACGLDRRVNGNDRLLFRTWTETWAMPQDVVLFVAQKAAGTTSPMAYVNRILADYKQQGIATLEQAQNHKPANDTTTTATKAKAQITNLERRTYTDEQINALFTQLDED